jgi:hypothetical protein
MRTELEDWKNGWVGVQLGLAPNEIDRVIELLALLKRDPEQHFHLSSDYRGTGGVGDITIYVQQPHEPDNMTTFGFALPPGAEIDAGDKPGGES